MTLVHFLGPGSNIFPGMSGVESDWSDRQMLCNTNDATAIINIDLHKMATVCCRSLSFSTLDPSLTDAVIDVKKLDITYS